MARVLNPTFIPTSTGAGPSLIPLEQIPQDVKDEAEEIFKILQQNEGRIRVQFDTVPELDLYLKRMKSYCEQRPAGKLYFRISPVRSLPDEAKEFRILAEAPEKSEKNGSAAAPEPAKKATVSVAGAPAATPAVVAKRGRPRKSA